jgi:hypothetical protein
LSSFRGTRNRFERAQPRRCPWLGRRWETENRRAERDSAEPGRAAIRKTRIHQNPLLRKPPVHSIRNKAKDDEIAIFAGVRPRMDHFWDVALGSP